MKAMKTAATIGAVLGLLLVNGVASAQEISGPYALHPTSHADTLVVEINNRLWITEMESGEARRLTDNNVEESTPALSPDGLEVAYVADAGAHLEVFVTDIETKATERLTYEGGFSVEVEGWLNETEVLFSSIGKAGKRGPLLFAVDRDTRRVRVLPLLEASEGCQLGDDLIFVKNQPLLDNVKNYRGGYAQQIYRIPNELVDTPEFIQMPGAPSVLLTGDYDGISRDPICLGERVFFLSDRSGTFNVWSINGDGDALTQHTFGEDHDIKEISSGDGNTIVFSRIGGVFRLDPSDGVVSRISLTLPESAIPAQFPATLAALSSEEFAISNDGTLVSLVIRGNLWAVDMNTLAATCLDCASGHRVRKIRFSHDGTRIFGLNDATGEFLLTSYDVTGRTGSASIPLETSSPIQNFMLSPNGRDIIIRLVDGTLIAHNGDTAKEIAVDTRTQPEEISWSHSGRYATFVTFNDIDIGRITVYDAHCHQIAYLTSGRHEVSSPVFVNDDNDILLIADMNFYSSVNDTWAPGTHWPSFDKRSLIHTVAFLPDNTAQQGNALSWQAAGLEVATDAACSARIERTSAIPPRARPMMRELPYLPGTYSNLRVVDDILLVFAKEAKRHDWGEIHAFPVVDDGPRMGPSIPLEQTIDVVSFSTNNRAMIGLTPAGIFISTMDAEGRFTDPDYRLNAFTPEVMIDRQTEYAQQFRDLWRLYRDYFWDEGMVGVDWAAQYDNYRPYLAGVASDAAFNDLVSYMVGELGAGHTSLTRTAVDTDETRAIASLGADLIEHDYEVFISAILDGDLDITDQRSPLTELSPPARVGDRIANLNGAPVLSIGSLKRMMMGKVGELVLLDIETPEGDFYRHRIELLSAGDESWLRNKAFAARNAALVDELGNERVGYIHMESAYADDFAEFVRQYTSLHDRDALILDLRGNSGGNVDPWVLHFLQRQAWLSVQDRYDSQTLKHPRDAFTGQLIVLIDGDTYSDGELIAEGVRQLGLGTLVGTRTTGAGIWVNDDRRLVNGAAVRIPVSASYFPGQEGGEMIIEGRGVLPDIEVKNDPYLFFHGRDTQLRAALELAMGER